MGRGPALVLGETVLPLWRRSNSVGREDPATGAVPDVDLTGFDDKRVVSRRHAEVVCDVGGVQVRDIGSTNGTTINGQPLPVHVFKGLDSGDELSFGGISLAYRVDAEWPAAVTAEWDEGTILRRLGDADPAALPAPATPADGSMAEPDRVLATVLFTDIAESTVRAAEMGDREWMEELAEHRVLVRLKLKQFGGREIDTAGDGFLAIFSSPAAAIRCATAISEAATQMGLPIRAGLHTGECLMSGDSIGGIAVHIAARVQAKAEPGTVFVSSTVKELVAGSGLSFRDRGSRALKGVPGKWRLFSVEVAPVPAVTVPEVEPPVEPPPARPGLALEQPVDVEADRT
ncbi:MAG: hypothetical protein QOE92_928 [Chloroflexota bacterium]|jgi:class 3 adenylate cyclase|nr:hypothetical protein [Chloroflexota bacterium]